MADHDNLPVYPGNQVLQKGNLVRERNRRAIRSVGRAAGKIDGVAAMSRRRQIGFDIMPYPSALPRAEIGRAHV